VHPVPTVLAALAIGAAAARSALVPPAHPLFAGDAVHQIELTFAQPDWWEQLTHNYEDFDDPPYLMADFTWDGGSLDSIGVRFKGNSSYWSYYGLKKSFKLDFDEYLPGQELFGLDKLNLNNGFLDASAVREKCAYELWAFLGEAACRTNYAALTINGEYWGLYLLVEQPDQEFLESRFGGGEEGNLWKGEPHGSLEWLGADPAAYHGDYELKTNEETDDWSALVDLVGALNNEPLEILADSLRGRVDPASAMAMLALDLFTVNLDSYVGRCANYYCYHRDRDDRFAFFKWDMNEAWGIFNLGMPLPQLQQLSLHWLNAEPRPLAARAWQLEGWDAVYLGHVRRLMAGPAQPDTLLARMEALRALIRPWVAADPNTMFTLAQFDANLESNVFASGGPPPGRLIPGLRPFVEARHAWLAGQLGEWEPPAGLALNELMADNAGTLADEAGDFDDWIELVNAGPAPLALGGLGLTDLLEGVPAWAFPDTALAPGGHLLLWADDEPEEGPLHLPFKLSAAGEDLYLTDGATVIDRVTWPALGADIAWGRGPDGVGAWTRLAAATPGAGNQTGGGGADPLVVVNEFLADNDNGLEDETGACEDWLELWNPGPEDAALGGLFLTDDFAQPTRWMLPDTTLPAGGFLVVWCDDDPGDGPLHATFKLSADGEEIGLFGRLENGNALLDGHEFGPQATDVSEGRLADGGPDWGPFAEPTPGEPNAGLAAVSDLAIAWAGGQVELSWTPVAGALGYRVRASDDPQAPYPAGWTLVGETAEPAWSEPLGASPRLYRVTAVR